MTGQSRLTLLNPQNNTVIASTPIATLSLSGYDLARDAGLIASEYMENLLNFLLERKFCYPRFVDKSGSVNSNYKLYSINNPIIVSDYANEIPDLSGSEPSDFLKDNFLNQLTRFINTYRETRASNTQEITNNMIINNLIQELVESHGKTKTLLNEKRNKIEDKINEENTDKQKNIDAIKEVIYKIEMRRFHIATLQDYSLLFLGVSFVALVIAVIFYDLNQMAGIVFYITLLILSIGTAYATYNYSIYGNRKLRIADIIAKKQKEVIDALN